MPPAAARGRKRDSPAGGVGGRPNVGVGTGGGGTGDGPSDPGLELALALEARGALEQALATCEVALAAAPDAARARSLRDRLRDALADRLQAQLGAPDQVPSLTTPPHEITWHKLDHQAGFMLTRIDGVLSVAELLSVSGMPRYETLRTLARLVELELVEIR